MHEHLLRGTFTVSPAASPSHIVIVMDEDPGSFEDGAHDDAELDAPAIEFRALPLGQSRTDATDVAMITAIVTDLAVNLTASALWDGIVGAVRRVLGTRKKADAEQTFRLTVVIVRGDQQQLVESEAIGSGSIKQGLASTERIVKQILKNNRKA